MLNKETAAPVAESKDDDWFLDAEEKKDRDVHSSRDSKALQSGPVETEDVVERVEMESFAKMPLMDDIKTRKRSRYNYQVQY